MAAEPLPTWDIVINGPGRFRVLRDFNNAAVLDRETGLVWEQSPDTGTRDWLGRQYATYGDESYLRWCGHAVEVVLVPEPEGWCCEVPILGEAA